MSIHSSRATEGSDTPSRNMSHVTQHYADQDDSTPFFPSAPSDPLQLRRCFGRWRLSWAATHQARELRSARDFDVRRKISAAFFGTLKADLLTAKIQNRRRIHLMTSVFDGWRNVVSGILPLLLFFNGLFVAHQWLAYGFFMAFMALICLKYFYRYSGTPL